MNFPRYNTRRICCLKSILLTSASDRQLKRVSRLIVNFERYSNSLTLIMILHRTDF